VTTLFKSKEGTSFETHFKEHTPHRKRSPPLKRGFRIKSVQWLFRRTALYSGQRVFVLKRAADLCREQKS